ncbi:hypothetical protein QWY84_10460 [Aquisalimonas lutea]|uniref:hypothetical protein n=1 Tax=Aquisalimonas lutea TaxID=1327750 RepID=UPI0025B289E5|nr:hypothetical protein [Aquisalimonas lutea]MDN3518031.1 hypothetical protein [Aquisalimonas lutea]
MRRTGRVICVCLFLSLPALASAQTSTTSPAGATPQGPRTGTQPGAQPGAGTPGRPGAAGPRGGVDPGPPVRERIRREQRAGEDPHQPRPGLGPGGDPAGRAAGAGMPGERRPEERSAGRDRASVPGEQRTPAAPGNRSGAPGEPGSQPAPGSAPGAGQ